MKFVVISLKKAKTIIALVLALTITLTTVMLTGAQSITAFNSNANRKLPIYGVQTEEKKIAISFDCAWGAEYTESLLETMREKGVKCTFFTVQFWTEKYPEMIKAIDQEGHEIGTHSATHPHMSSLSRQAIKGELESSMRSITEITGKKVELFRPPFGEYDDEVIVTAEELGLYTIQWSVDSLDWKDLSAKEIENRVISRVKNGSIVLFHNNGKHTAEALPKIIDLLQKDGYEFVRIGDLIYRENYKIAVDGTQIKN